MSPNDVKELLDALITELKLPLIASDSGPLVVSEKSDRLTQSKIEKVVEQWLNENNLSYGIYVGRSASERDEATTRLALETYRVPEIKEVLKSLIAEQSLPLNVVDWGFQLEILADEGVGYRNNDMMKLKTMLEKEGLDIPVCHNGFNLWQEDGANLELSQFQTLANRLASALERYGLHVQLLHKGFELQKNADIEVNIAEAKELTYRLENMVGIRYVQGGYRYSNDALNPEIHWTSADVTTALPF